MDAISSKWSGEQPLHRSNPGWAYVARALADAGIAQALHVRDGRNRLVAGEVGVVAPHVVIRVNDWLFPLKLALHPSLAVGEAYMDGRLELLTGSLRDFLALGARFARHGERSQARKALNRIARLMAPANGPRRASRNARHHYDLTPDFYRLFLDQRMQYSCGYFREGAETLDEAQVAKIAHIAAKLDLRPGQSLLDIGCGWGTLALTLAQAAGVVATGLTPVPGQCDEARRLASASEASATCRFALSDYRDWTEQHDRIVSVGMLEHVGRASLGVYFAQIARLLKPGGVALVHAIGRWDGETGPDPWTDRHIFPGGHIPSLSEVMPAIEASGLKLLDVEILRLHYAYTLEHWAKRFASRRDEARAMFGERFCRMWEFYLAAAETGFREGQLMVFQILVAHERDSLPITRDFICRSEQKWHARIAPGRK